MQFLSIILLILLIFAFLLDYRIQIVKKNAFQIINEMGIGYNLGHSFDCYNSSIEIKTPDEQITLYGNPLPTKELISNIKKNGFKTIRFPVTWINFIDDFGNVSSEWILRVKEVVKWIIGKKIFCILNIYNDGEEGNWLNKFSTNTKDKFIRLWSQIAEEFKDFNEYLIFESMSKPLFHFGNEHFDYDYYSLYNISQAFVDTIRNSGNYNR